MAAVQETYVPRLKQRYQDQLRGELREQLGLSSIMQAPTISKTKNWRLAEVVEKAK